jgi:hypothetical protein
MNTFWEHEIDLVIGGDSLCIKHERYQPQLMKDGT